MGSFWPHLPQRSGRRLANALHIPYQVCMLVHLSLCFYGTNKRRNLAVLFVNEPFDVNGFGHLMKSSLQPCMFTVRIDRSDSATQSKRMTMNNNNNNNKIQKSARAARSVICGKLWCFESSQMVLHILRNFKTSFMIMHGKLYPLSCDFLYFVWFSYNTPEPCGSGYSRSTCNPL